MSLHFEALEGQDAAAAGMMFKALSRGHQGAFEGGGKAMNALAEFVSWELEYGRKP